MKGPGALSGLTVLVTGAASGIGRQLARDLFWQERCHLLLLDKDGPRLELLRDELSPAPPPGSAPPRQAARAFVCDIASPDSVERFVAEIAGHPVDILVNNAGVFYLGNFERMALADFERVLGVNLLGSIRMTQAVLPKLLQSRHAFIVNVASLAGLKGAPGMCAYAASKFGLVGFSQALAAELEGRVGVAAVCPGLTRTGIADNSLLGPEALGARRAGMVGAMNALLSLVGSNPRKVSQAIIRSIKEGKRFVLVNPDAHLLYYLDRFLPRISDSLVRAGYRRMLKAGLIEP